MRQGEGNQGEGQGEDNQGGGGNQGEGMLSIEGFHTEPTQELRLYEH